MGFCCVVACGTATLLSLSASTWTWINGPLVVALWALVSVLGIIFTTLLSRNAPLNYALLLTSNGIIRRVDDNQNVTKQGALYEAHTGIDESLPMQIHASSQLFPWGLNLNVATVSHKRFSKGYAHLGWVLKNECSQADYRRLCRAIILAKKECV